MSDCLLGHATDRSKQFASQALRLAPDRSYVLKVAWVNSVCNYVHNDALMRASKMFPDSSETWLWRANFSRDPDEVKECLEKVMDLNPGLMAVFAQQVHECSQCPPHVRDMRVCSEPTTWPESWQRIRTSGTPVSRDEGQ